MMHRCSGSHGNVMGPCSCGVFHSQSNSFSMLFSMPPPGNHHKPNYDEDHDHMYSFASPSSVDCTLSLGTPSTRLTNNNDYSDKSRRSSNCVSNFCWDILHPKHSSSSSSSHQSTHKSIRGAASNSNSSGAENLLARRCANCDTTSTPLWRNGPKGPKSLCNACGIRFKKEERRATAAAATNGGSSSGGSGAVVDPQHMLNSSWVHHNSQTQKIPYISSAYANEFRFIEDDDHRDTTDTAIPFLSWRLNVTDRPGLVHEFTR